MYLPSGNWFEFSRLVNTLYVNPCFQFLNSTSENRKCGKKYFLGDSAWRDFELNSERENLTSSYPRDSWISNLGVQYKTWSIDHSNRYVFFFECNWVTYADYNLCFLLQLLAFWGFFMDYLNARERDETYFKWCNPLYGSLPWDWSGLLFSNYYDYFKSNQN